MFYGESNVPGAAGNLRGVKDLVYRNEPVQAVPMPYYGGGMGVEELAGGNFLGGQGSAINPDAFKKDARQQKIYNKGMGTDNPNEREIFLKRTGPQLPLAGFYPGPQGVGNVGALSAIAMEPPYTARERSEDQIILRSLQKGEMGTGPHIDKAIQDLIQRTSIGGTGLRGV